MNRGYFSKKIVQWYAASHRDLPWRNTQDPYKIWLSEIILQQTRVAQGFPYYLKFIQNYPHVKSLAEAPEQEVLRLWQGLGYYTRARNLHACARKVTRDLNGKFPDTWEELRELPGIGDYTAAAIASFAFERRVAVVDGNVYRVLARIFGVDKDIGSPEGKKSFSVLANQLIPTEQPGQHNQAVMEFGAMQCLPQNPHCEVCIFRSVCFAFKHDLQQWLPVKLKKQKVAKRFFWYFIFRKGKKILMTPRIKKDIWRGLFDFPMIEGRGPMGSKDVLSKIFPTHGEFSMYSPSATVSKEYKHILTHQIIRARFIEIDWSLGKKLPEIFSAAQSKWNSSHQIEQLPKPRLITRYLEDRDIL